MAAPVSPPQHFAPVKRLDLNSIIKTKVKCSEVLKCQPSRISITLSVTGNFEIQAKLITLGILILTSLINIARISKLPVTDIIINWASLD